MKIYRSRRVLSTGLKPSALADNPLDLHKSSYHTQPRALINTYNLYLPSAVFIAQVLVGPSKQLKQIIQIQHKLLRIPTGGRQTSWLFTRAAEKLNSGLPRTTSASGQNGI